MAALQHVGDNKGSVEGGSFAGTIYVELSRLPESCNALVFTINSFQGQTFTDISSAYVVLSDDQGSQLLRYDLTDTQPSTALLIAVSKRSAPDGWHLSTIGEFDDCRTVRKLVHPAARQSTM